MPKRADEKLDKVTVDLILVAAGLVDIAAASRGLRMAERQLERTRHEFGGHRAKALELIKQAEKELQEAVAYAKANPPKPSTSGTPARGGLPAPATPPAPETQ